MVKKIFYPNSDKVLTELRLSESGKQWFVSYWVSGKRQKKYGSLNSEPEIAKRYLIAEELFRDIESELLSNIPPSAAIVELEKVIDEFIQSKSKFWRKKTLQTYRSKCTCLITWIKEQKLTDFTQDDAHAFEEHLRNKVSKSTFNEYVRIFGVIWKKLFPSKANLFLDMETYKGNHKVPALYFQAHQRKRIASSMQDKEPYLWLFVQFIFYSFIRPGEIRLLKVGDIYPEECKILVRAEIAKNKKRQFVHIPKPLMASILESNILDFSPNFYLFSTSHQPSPDPMGSRYMAIRHQKLITSLGFDTNLYKLYSWKHTGAVACYKAGMKLKDLQLQMRHASIEETDGYLRSIGINDVATDIDAIFPEI